MDAGQEGAVELPRPDSPSVPARGSVIGVLIAIFLLLLVLSCASVWMAIAERCVMSSREGGELIVRAPHRGVFAAAAYGFFGGLALLFLCGLGRLFRRQITLGISSLAGSVAILLSGFVVAAPLGHFSAPWTAHGQVRGLDGRDYRFLNQWEALPGYWTMSIATPIRRGLLWTDYAVKVRTCGYSWARLIRPAGAVDVEGAGKIYPTSDNAAYGQLCLSPTGTVYGMVSSNYCYLAYDPSTSTAIGRWRIPSTSPFVLLGPDTPIHQPDADAMLKEEPNRCSRYWTGWPTTESLEDGLKHPNPAVRKLAKGLLDIRNTPQ